MSAQTGVAPVHTEPMLPILTEEERQRAAQWLVNNAPHQFRFSTDSTGFFAAVRTLRDGVYRP